MDRLTFKLLRKLYRKNWLPYCKFGHAYDPDTYPEQNEYVNKLLSDGYIKSKELNISGGKEGESPLL